MDTDTTPVETKGISRRAVIVGGATGAAAFWSVPIIDSVTQRAAAASGCAAPIGTISYIFVVYTNASGTHYAGTKGTSWGDQGTFKVTQSAGVLCTPSCGGIIYGTVGFNGGAPAGGFYSNPSASGCLTSGTAIPYVSDPGSDLVINNGKITPGTGVTINAFFFFQAGSSGAGCGSSVGGVPCGITFG